MDHSRFQTLIQLHIDKALSPAEEQELEQHLALCPDCAAYLRDMCRVDELLAAELTEVEPPADFARLVMAALPDKAGTDKADAGKASGKAAGRKRGSYWAWGAIAAAALLLFAAASALFAPAHTLAPPPELADDEASRPELALPNAPIVAEQEQEQGGSDNDSQTEADDPEVKEDSPGEIIDDTPHSSVQELPTVASSTQTQGAYSMITLASVANCDALRPQVSGSLVTFYVNLDGSCLQWQTSLDGSGNAVFLGECAGLPALPGAGRYNSDESGREWYSATSPSGAYVADNTASGLYINDQLAASAGGGYLISWAADGNRLFFTDGGGSLHVYYPASGLLLDVADRVSSATWSGSNIVMSAYDSSTGYYSVFRVTLP